MPTATNAKYGTAARRWAGIGPYYAMFPISFANKVIRKHSEVGDVVLDPFSGRGTAVFAAAAAERHGIGVEINPVGYIYTKTKLGPASKQHVEARISELGDAASKYAAKADDLPEFFRHCYCPDVLQFLLAARAKLDWKSSIVDCTVMSFLMVHLHGKRTDSLSNQMRQTKALSPQYSIEWWRERKLKPPKLDPVDFLTKKLKWRYAKGKPHYPDSRVFLGDSQSKVGNICRTLEALGKKSVKLLLTSPPYCGVTNYHYDQWLRLWLLGWPNAPTAPAGPNQGKFVDQEKYRAMLEQVFCNCAEYMEKSSIVYVRTDSREHTLDATVEVLRKVFPKKTLRTRKQPCEGPNQTELFGGESAKCEVDVVLK